jgi:hypothetical protein
MQNCIEDIRIWMRTNKLKLNDSKTEVLIVTSPHSSKHPHMESIQIKIGEDVISPKHSVKNLGAVIDATLSMDHQVNAVTRSIYFNLRRIANIKNYLTPEACAKAVNATVLSRLDFHNGLLLGLPDRALHKLQVAQNNAARLLTGTSRKEHITPVLKNLHWLPVRQRVTFKTLSLIQKSLHSPVAPPYMREMHTVYEPGRSLRSSQDQWKLTVQRSRNKYGSRSYKSLGAQLWNKLPYDVRAPTTQAAFRRKLKTFLFKETYT